MLPSSITPVSSLSRPEPGHPQDAAPPEAAAQAIVSTSLRLDSANFSASATRANDSDGDYDGTLPPPPVQPANRHAIQRMMQAPASHPIEVKPTPPPATPSLDQAANRSARVMASDQLVARQAHAAQSVPEVKSSPRDPEPKAPESPDTTAKA